MATEKQKETARENRIKWNKSEKGKQASRQNAKRLIEQGTFGKEVLIRFNKSSKHRNQLIEYNKSDEHRKIARKIGETYGREALAKWARSEAGRDNARVKARKMGKANGGKNLAKANSLVPTKSQQLLSKGLLDIGVKNKLEWWVQEIRRSIDIAIPEKMVAVEVDGSSHDGMMGLSKEQKQEDDNLKDQQLYSLGWKVFRFTNEEVNTDLNYVIKRIKSELENE